MNGKKPEILTVVTKESGTIVWELVPELTLENSNLKAEALRILKKLMTCMMTALVVEPDLGLTLLQILEDNLTGVEVAHIALMTAAQEVARVEKAMRWYEGVQKDLITDLKVQCEPA